MSEFSYQILLFVRHIMLAVTASTSLFGFLYIRKFGSKSEAAEHLYHPHIIALLAQAIAWFFLITNQAPISTATAITLGGALRGMIVSGPITIWLLLSSGMFGLLHALSPKEFTRHLGSYYVLTFVFSSFLVLTEQVPLAPAAELSRVILQNVLTIFTFGVALVLEVLFLRSWKHPDTYRELRLSFRSIIQILLSALVVTFLITPEIQNSATITGAWLFQKTLMLVIMITSLFLAGPVLASMLKPQKNLTISEKEKTQSAIGIIVTSLTVAWIGHESIPIFPTTLVTYSLYLAMYLVALLVVYLIYLLEEDIA